MSTEMKGLDLETTVNSMNATLGNLKLTTEKLNSSDNSLGLLLNDKALYENMGNEALRFVANRFNIQNIVDQNIQFYKNVL